MFLIQIGFYILNHLIEVCFCEVQIKYSRGQIGRPKANKRDVPDKSRLYNQRTNKWNPYK